MWVGVGSWSKICKILFTYLLNGPYGWSPIHIISKFNLGYGDSGGGINPLAAFIAPLAGLALLGAAAAVSINPVLVQLAVVNGGRKKRDLRDPNMQRKVTEIELLENFLSKETKFDSQAESMVAQYLECSGLSSDQNQVWIWNQVFMS